MKALCRCTNGRGITYTPDTVATSNARRGRPHAATVTKRRRSKPRSGVRLRSTAFMNTLNVTHGSQRHQTQTSSRQKARRSSIAACCPARTPKVASASHRTRGDPRIEVEFAGRRAVGGTRSHPRGHRLFWTINDGREEKRWKRRRSPSHDRWCYRHRFLRARGIPPTASSLLLSRRSGRLHGNNEFLTIENLNMGCELMYEVVRRISC